MSEPLGYMTSPTSLDDLKARFASNLRARRLEIGLSQEKLSVLAQVHRTYISQVERQVCNPTLEMMLSMANALDIDIAELLKK
ncbi:MAG: helix-turn-helix domain-containing protein [Telluria sp.]